TNGLNGIVGIIVLISGQNYGLFAAKPTDRVIWRQSARVNAAAFRVRERTELIALDAAEAYVDVVRYLRLIELGQQNVAIHEKIFSNVNSRFTGGRAGE